MERHYAVLGLSPDADLEEVRRTYRILSKEHHLDSGGSRSRFLRIKRAYEAITGSRSTRWSSDRNCRRGSRSKT